MDLAVRADHTAKLKESEKKDKYFDLAWKSKKPWNMKVMVIPIVISAFGTVPKRTIKVTGGLGSWRTSRDHPNYYTIEIGQNTEKNPGDMRRLAVTQTAERGHQLTLV